MSFTKIVQVQGYSLERSLSKDEMNAVVSLLRIIAKDDLSSTELIANVYRLSENYGLVLDLELEVSVRAIATVAYRRYTS